MAQRTKAPKKCKSCKTPCSPKTESKKKQKAPKMGAYMDPSYAWWDREDFIKRRIKWMWRLRPYVLEHNEQCDSCTRKAFCHKIPLDERCTVKMLNGEECKDYKSMWKKILGDDKEHDWGF